MYEIDTKQAEKIEKLIQLEKQKENQRYSLCDAASAQAAKIIAQYANLMFTTAEVPPSFALNNAVNFKNKMNESTVFSNPVTLLTAVNNIAKMSVKNDDLTPVRKERAKGASQLYSIAVLLDRIDKYKSRPEFRHILTQINSLSDTVKQSLMEIYGSDIFEKIKYFGSLSEKLSDKDKKAALDFILDVDAQAEGLILPDSFETELSELVEMKNRYEEREKEAEFIINTPLSIKLNYPDHDHNPSDIHTHSHEYMHRHGIEHTHENTIRQKVQYN